MISLPLFYSTQYAQMAVLMVIQVMEIARVLYMKPFYTPWRNNIRIALDFILFLFFFCNIYQSTLVKKIMLNDPETISQTVGMFYGIGWAGVAFCFIFNISHILLSLYDLYRGCLITTR